MKSSIVVVSLCFALFNTAFAAEPATPKPKTLEQWSQEALERAFQQLKTSGQVQSHAQSAFDSEVAVAPMVFVRNYEVTRETTSVDVDQDRLKGFLNFQSQLVTGQSEGPPAPGAVNAQTPKICISVRDLRDANADAENEEGQTCTACAAFATQTQSAASQFFERRGFRAVTGPQSTGDSALSGDRAFEDYVVRSQAQGCDDAFLATVSSYSDSSVEAGVLKVDSYLMLRDRKQTRIKGLSSSRLSDSTVTELMRDKHSMIKLGVMVAGEAAAVVTNRIVQEQQAAALGNGSTEALLAIQNIPDYQTFVTVRDRVLSLVPGLELRERLLSPGTVEFSYATSMQSTVSKKLRDEVSQFGAVGGVAAQLTTPEISHLDETTIKLVSKIGG